VAGPNCTTIVLLMAVAPLHRAVGIERLIVSSYQAASGMGLPGLEELEAGLRAHVAGGEPPSPAVFPRPLAGNAVPQCDAFCLDGSWQDGFTREELKLVHETRKILGDPTIRIAGTTVRVPVQRAHSLSVLVELRRPLALEEARRLLRAAPGVRLVDDPGAADPAARYPTALDAAAGDDTLVGRLRRDPSSEHGILLWAVGDQIRKGAALNAVQIAEHLPSPT
jgi:aspartate-semialdehyde dehydrogenase